MKRKLAVLLSAASLCALSLAAAKSLELKDLPPAVQKTVQEQSKGSEIKNISKEVEKGITQYEVETLLNGKHRDFDVDTKGNLLTVEQEVSLDTIPAAAKAAILKKISTGKPGKMEAVTTGNTTLYEAAYTSKHGRKHEVLVKADGTETKD